MSHLRTEYLLALFEYLAAVRAAQLPDADPRRIDECWDKANRLPDSFWPELEKRWRIERPKVRSVNLAFMVRSIFAAEETPQ